jgi:hypothetical protein
VQILKKARAIAIEEEIPFSVKFLKDKVFLIRNEIGPVEPGFKLKYTKVLLQNKEKIVVNFLPDGTSSEASIKFKPLFRDDIFFVITIEPATGRVKTSKIKGRQ